jgi:hypothetical protein
MKGAVDTVSTAPFFDTLDSIMNICLFHHFKLFKMSEIANCFEVSVSINPTIVFYLPGIE